MDQCNNPLKIGIVGAGFSGICAAVQLQKQLNIDTFTIFDENHEVGGTWLVNTYPGCACDVQSHLYSFSFEPNPYWSKAYSPGKEIWEYLRDVAQKHDLYPKIKFNHRVTETHWDEKINKWHVTVKNVRSGEESRQVFDIVINCVGALRIPNWPEQFKPFKVKTHSAQWDSSLELKDKVVAIVGSGATAVQIIPEIVDKVKRLIVYQRHPAWVVPKVQYEYPGFMQWAFAYIPGIQFALRNWIFWSRDIFHSAFKVGTLLSRFNTKMGHKHLESQIEDPALREKLTPSYSIGCKRITPSNDYYPALAKANVTLVTSKITEVTEDTIVNEDGTVEKPDVLILATGFKVQDYFAPMKVTGKDGVDIMSKWKKTGPSAYAGIVTSDMPNSFFLLGPNTGLGHNTIVFMIECQTNWMIDTIREMTERNARIISVKKSAEEEYMEYILKSLKSTVWGATECGSWYADHRGVITTLWPESLVSYYNLTKKVDFSKLEFS